MAWKRLFGRQKDTKSPPAPATPQPDASGIVRRWPPAADPATQGRLDTLRQRRDMAAYDLERAMSARQADNPWRERMELLDRSLATIEDDLRALDATQPLPPITLPETPITNIEVNLEEPLSVAFTIGPERFRWEEEIDWDQRGGPVVRGQVQQRSGNAAALVPPGVPAERREALERHLDESTTVFALDLRDRALEGEPLPDRPTLADLARPCPVCGNWLDWRGHCDTCAARAFRRQSLHAEAARIAQERDEEEEDRHKWAERVPVARKRLADLETEIAKLE
ncbi:MAG: hypothetical protein ACRDJC_04845 [Thermomicrobiales bacterium]